MRLKLPFLAFSLCCLMGCDKAPGPDLSSAPADAIEQGMDLIPTYCNTCHGVGDLGMEEMLAPPLWGVRAHYLARHPEPEAFVDAMTAFILEPKVAESLMPSAVERYGLKAPVSLSEKEIRAVVWAIYANRVERPSWARAYQKLHSDSEAVW
jgi:mono/diheme cytochrome c family protein